MVCVGNRVSTRRFRFPFRERRKISAALPHMIADDLPFEPEDILYDWEFATSERNQAEVIATIAPRNVVSSFLEPLGEAECAPRTLEVEGLVLGNLAAVFDLAGNRLLVDLGHRKTTLCLMLDERAVAARTVPLGGLSLTEALAKDRGLEFDPFGLERIAVDQIRDPPHPPAVSCGEQIRRHTFNVRGDHMMRPISWIQLIGRRRQ